MYLLGPPTAAAGVGAGPQIVGLTINSGVVCPTLEVCSGMSLSMTICGCLLWFVVQEWSGGVMLAMPQHKGMAGWVAPVGVGTNQGSLWGALAYGRFKSHGSLVTDQLMAEAVRVARAKSRETAIAGAAYGTKLVPGSIIDALKPPHA